MSDCIARTEGWEWPADLEPDEQRRGELFYSLWDKGNKSVPFDMSLAGSTVALDADIFNDGFESSDTSAWSNTLP